MNNFGDEDQTDFNDSLDNEDPSEDMYDLEEDPGLEELLHPFEYEWRPSGWISLEDLESHEGTGREYDPDNPEPPEDPYLFNPEEDPEDYHN